MADLNSLSDVFIDEPLLYDGAGLVFVVNDVTDVCRWEITPQPVALQSDIALKPGDLTGHGGKFLQVNQAGTELEFIEKLSVTASSIVGIIHENNLPASYVVPDHKQVPHSGQGFLKRGAGEGAFPRFVELTENDMPAGVALQSDVAISLDDLEGHVCKLVWVDDEGRADFLPLADLPTADLQLEKRFLPQKQPAGVLKSTGETTLFSELEADDIPDLDAAKITSGVLDIARLPANLVSAADVANVLRRDSVRGDFPAALVWDDEIDDYIDNRIPENRRMPPADSLGPDDYGVLVKNADSYDGAGNVVSIGAIGFRRDIPDGVLPSVVLRNYSDVSEFPPELARTDQINTLTGTVQAIRELPSAGSGFLERRGNTVAYRRLVAGDIPVLDAGKITTGRFGAERLPTDTVYQTALNTLTRGKLHTEGEIQGFFKRYAWDASTQIATADIGDNQITVAKLADSINSEIAGKINASAVKGFAKDNAVKVAVSDLDSAVDRRLLPDSGKWRSGTLPDDVVYDADISGRLLPTSGTISDSLISSNIARTSALTGLLDENDLASIDLSKYPAGLRNSEVTVPDVTNFITTSDLTQANIYDAVKAIIVGGTDSDTHRTVTLPSSGASSWDEINGVPDFSAGSDGQILEKSGNALIWANKPAGGGGGSTFVGNLTQNTLTLRHGQSAGADASIVVERGTSGDDAKIVWDHSDTAWKAGTGTDLYEVLTSNSAIPIAPYEIRSVSLTANANADADWIWKYNYVNLDADRVLSVAEGLGKVGDVMTVRVHGAHSHALTINDGDGGDIIRLKSGMAAVLTRTNEGTGFWHLYGELGSNLGIAESNIPNLPASKITTGTLSRSVLPVFAPFEPLSIAASSNRVAMDASWIGKVVGIGYIEDVNIVIDDSVGNAGDIIVFDNESANRLVFKRLIAGGRDGPELFSIDGFTSISIIKLEHSRGDRWSPYAEFGTAKKSEVAVKVAELAGQSGKLVKVNENENGVEFFEDFPAPVISNFSISNFPQTITAGTTAINSVDFTASVANVENVQQLIALQFRQRPFTTGIWSGWVNESGNVPALDYIKASKSMRSITLEAGSAYQWRLSVWDVLGRQHFSNTVELKTDLAPAAQMRYTAYWGKVDALNDLTSTYDLATNAAGSMDVSERNAVFDAFVSEVEDDEFYYILTPPDRSPISIAAALGGNLFDEEGNLRFFTKEATNRTINSVPYEVYYRRNESGEDMPFNYSVITE